MCDKESKWKWRKEKKNDDSEAAKAFTNDFDFWIFYLNLNGNIMPIKKCMKELFLNHESHKFNCAINYIPCLLLLLNTYHEKQPDTASVPRVSWSTCVQPDIDPLPWLSRFKHMCSSRHRSGTVTESVKACLFNQAQLRYHDWVGRAHVLNQRQSWPDEVDSMAGVQPETTPAQWLSWFQHTCSTRLSFGTGCVGSSQWRIYIVKFWTRAPGGPNSFNFMQFLGNFGKIVFWRPPPESWRTLLWEILDPPLRAHGVQPDTAPVPCRAHVFVVITNPTINQPCNNTTGKLVFVSPLSKALKTQHRTLQDFSGSEREVKPCYIRCRKFLSKFPRLCDKLWLSVLWQ